MHTITTTVHVPEDRRVHFEIELPPECESGEMEVTLFFCPVEDGTEGEAEDGEIQYPAAMLEMFDKYRDVLSMDDEFTGDS